MKLRFKSSLRSVRDFIGTRLMPTGSGFGLNRNDREGALHRAWGLIFTNQIRGAYYEFGVYRGDSFRIAHRVYQAYSSWQEGQVTSDEDWRRVVAKDYSTFRHEFYAFDSFTGLPDNDEGNVTFGSGNFACSLEEFDKLNREQGIVQGNGVRYFGGYFDETSQRNVDAIKELQPAAIVNLDCDLYVSAVDALAIIKPKLLQGTIFLADDWYTFSADRNAGERKAVAEFLTENPNIKFEPWFQYFYSGQAFLVHVD